jgi:diaminohydroxyphosphoribosylaminopyrimidine deaminase/5-amino-6-(5-phosphoribosylamino)uracil reductase
VDAHDIRFMQHALALARKSVGLTSPNPMVGCVIVRDGHIVGEGFHQYEWRDHAEVVALKSAGEKARGATMYVTLEPCNHTGRTGPCTEAIVAAGIGRVVAAMQDPNPVTSGRGLARLRDSGVEVASEICEDEARRLNEAFAVWIRSKRPLVTLKSALTLDGQLALPAAASSKNAKAAGVAKKNARQNSRDHSRQSVWISSEESRAEVHRMRHASDALLTGIGTALADNPLLTDRSGMPRRRRLLRVIVDSELRLPPASRIVKTADDDLLVFTAASLNSAKARKLQASGVEVMRTKTKRGHIDLAVVLAELGRRDVLSVLLEAGPSLNGSALAGGLVHKLVLFYAPKIAGKTVVPFASGTVVHAIPPQTPTVQQFGPDLCVGLYLSDIYRR